jgi:hypothetical protein
MSASIGQALRRNPRVRCVPPLRARTLCTIRFDSKSPRVLTVAKQNAKWGARSQFGPEKIWLVFAKSRAQLVGAIKVRFVQSHRVASNDHMNALAHPSAMAAGCGAPQLTICTTTGLTPDRTSGRAPRPPASGASGHCSAAPPLSASRGAPWWRSEILISQKPMSPMPAQRTGGLGYREELAASTGLRWRLQHFDPCLPLPPFLLRLAD